MRGWAAVAIAAGVGSALVLRHNAALADPITCPGLFDLFAVIAARTWREVPLGSMLAAGNAVAIVLALALLARAIYVVTSNAFVTIAIAVAASASSVFAAVLAPSAALAFVVTLATWAAVLRAREAHPPARSRGVALFLLALLAATVTPMMLPAAIVAGCLGWTRWSVRAAAVAVVLGSSHLTQMAIPRAHSCVIPHAWSLTTAGGVIADAARGAGPLAIALVLLGLVAIKRLPRGIAVSLAILVLVSFWGSMLMPERPAWIIAPFTIAFWVLAAAGLVEVWEAAGQTAGGRVGAAALALTLAVLQIVNANSNRDAGALLDGHERLTLAMMSTIVGALPRGAGLVEEDAATDLLTRALPSRVRTPDRFHIVPRNASAVSKALAGSPVFALPRSQRVLQHVGIEMADATSAGVTGLAEIRQGHACTAELGIATVPLSILSGQRVFALVADDEPSQDRVLIMLAGEAPLPVSTPNWPPASIRGIEGRTFDLTVAADQRDFAEELRSYELSSGIIPGVRYVTRMELRRIPGAPLVLPIALGGVIAGGAAKRLGTSRDQHLKFCPSYPYEVRRVW